MAKRIGKSFRVDTKPSKKVVVDSLTRDISVDACIFDLIDNSIDAARDTIYLDQEIESGFEQLPESFDGYKIEITLGGEGFSIADNCGGIPVDKLREMVLRFGERSSHKMGIGVFGLGLNRALFKLGRVSHLKTDTGLQRAELVLNTDKYLGSKDWNLPAEEFPTSGQIGTVIEILQLPSDIARRFGDPSEIETLRHDIGRRYGRFIASALKISINGTAINNEEVGIRENGPFEIKRKSYKTTDGVSINIECGQHRDHRFTAEPDYNSDRNLPLTKQYGWTILCNDRAIVVSDKTPKTGWDGKFHTEFYGFVGLVRFVGPESDKLPWATTKIDVDLNNNAYQMALEDMRQFAEIWRKNANKAKATKRKNEVLTPIPGLPSQSQNSETKKNEDVANGKKTKGAKVDAPKYITKIDHNQFRTILPLDVDEKYCYDKHLALVHEAKNLDLGELTYAGLVLIRMLFEATVATHLARHGKYDAFRQEVLDKRRQEGLIKNAQDEKNMNPTMDEASVYLVNNPSILGTAKRNHLKHSLGRMKEHKKILNSAAHNPYQPINRSEAFQIRDEVLPILRHLIET
ncbi:ATP-binding protein [Collimonas silvisoli]|uniref:ATP-binding protein n=1 Tax=Collimonas silvisoli TaxID=2825884 RepID=UPI001B8DAA74|nr:ATP-binding protein [Collimonas silvisoli]